MNRPGKNQDQSARGNGGVFRTAIWSGIILLVLGSRAFGLEIHDKLSSWASASVDERIDLSNRISVQARTLKPNATGDYLFQCIDAVARDPAQRDKAVLEIASLCAILSSAN